MSENNNSFPATLSEQAARYRRPRMVLVCSAMLCLYAIWLAVGALIIVRGSPPIPMSDHVQFALRVLLTFGSGVALFRMSSTAPYLLTAEMVLRLPNLLAHILTGGAMMSGGTPAYVFMMADALISVGICVYAWELLRTGELRPWRNY